MRAFGYFPCVRKVTSPIMVISNYIKQNQSKKQNLPLSSRNRNIKGAKINE